MQSPLELVPSLSPQAVQGLEAQPELLFPLAEAGLPTRCLAASTSAKPERSEAEIRFGELVQNGLEGTGKRGKCIRTP